MQPTFKEIKAKYSVKRKRDVVTFLAISMFILLVLFQLFLTLVMPMVLKKKNAFEFYVAKLEMSKQVDEFRNQLSHVDWNSDLQKGEIHLVEGVTDHLALFVRDSLDYLNEAQIAQLKRIFRQFESVKYRWTMKPSRFHVVEESLNMPAMIKTIESDLQE